VLPKGVAGPPNLAQAIDSWACDGMGTNSARTRTGIAAMRAAQ